MFIKKSIYFEKKMKLTNAFCVQNAYLANVKATDDILISVI